MGRSYRPKGATDAVAHKSYGTIVPGALEHSGEAPEREIVSAKAATGQLFQVIKSTLEEHLKGEVLPD